METFKIENIGGHILIQTGGDRLLIDTGSPASFSASGSITLGTETISVPQSLMGVSPTYVTDKVGVHVQGMIGMDLIRRFSMAVDLEAGEVIFGVGTEGWTRVPSFNIPGSVVMDITLGGRTARVIPDTGAPTSYIDPSFTEGLRSVGTVEDFSPFSASDTFSTPLFDVSASLAGRDFTLRLGHLPSDLRFMLQVLHVDGCIGLDFLRQFKVMFTSEGVWVR